MFLQHVSCLARPLLYCAERALIIFLMSSQLASLSSPSIPWVLTSFPVPRRHVTRWLCFSAWGTGSLALGRIRVVTHSRSRKVNYPPSSNLALRFVVAVGNVNFTWSQPQCRIVMLSSMWCLQERECCPQSPVPPLLFVSGSRECGEGALHVEWLENSRWVDTWSQGNKSIH